MTPTQTLEIRAGTIRARLAEIGGLADMDDEVRSELDALKTEYIDNDARRSALLIADDGKSTIVDTTSAEGRELVELRSGVDFGRYVAAAMSGNGVSDGAEREYNQHLGIADNYFPMALLAGKYEERAARDGDAETSQATWLDRVFNNTAAERVGISFRPVSPGVSAFPRHYGGRLACPAWTDRGCLGKHLHRGRD